jgi:hypothetical protein
MLEIIHKSGYDNLAMEMLVIATPSDGVNFIPYMKLLGVE